MVPAEFEDIHRTVAVAEHARVIVAPHALHAAAGMAMGEITREQRHVLVQVRTGCMPWLIRRARDRDREIMVAFQAAALAAAGREVRDRDAHRNTGRARRAVVAVDELATAAKTLGEQLPVARAAQVDRGVDQQALHLAVVQIGAGLRGRNKPTDRVFLHDAIVTRLATGAKQEAGPVPQYPEHRRGGRVLAGPQRAARPRQ